MITIRKLVVLLLALLATSITQAGSRFLDHESILISSIRVIDGLGNDPVETQGILIIDGKISTIGESGALGVRDDVFDINGAGMTAMPGLVDTHSHANDGASDVIDEIQFEATSPQDIQNQFVPYVKGVSSLTGSLTIYGR